MSDEDALLAAIAAHPDEDTPRLAYADWLDEHGSHTRAEFIRVQVEVARVETLPRIILNRHVDVFRRNQELIDNHRDELLGPLAAVLLPGTPVEFRRGFVSEVALDAWEFGNVRRGLAAVQPLPRVIVTGAVNPVRHFLGIDVSRPDPDPHTHLVAAIRTKYDPDMNGDDEWGTYEPRLHLSTWPRLDELDLSGCRLGDANTAALLRAEAFPVLADLDLSANELTDSSVTNLLDSGLPRQLKRLILGGNPISDPGATMLAARWPEDADKLEALNLRFTNIGPRGQQALLARFGGRLELF